MKFNNKNLFNFRKKLNLYNNRCSKYLFRKNKKNKN